MSNIPEEDINKAIEFLEQECESYEPFTPHGLNKLPYVLYEAVAKAMIEYARKELAELKAENERRLQAINQMLTALNGCGREIHWNTSTEIEAAYAEMRAISKSALSGTKETE